MAKVLAVKSRIVCLMRGTNVLSETDGCEKV